MRFTFVILLFCGLGADAQMIIKAHANYRPYAVAAAQNLLLDDYPNAKYVFSFRKLRTAYSGKCVRIRKDSTGQAETDIDFVNNEIDTNAIKNFVGNNSAYITVWYNQTDTTFSASNASNATASQQPRIVNNGVIERQNGKVCSIFDGSNDFLSSGGINNTGQWYIFSVVKPNVTTGSQAIFAGGINVNIGQVFVGYGFSGSKQELTWGDFFVASSTNNVTTNMQLMTYGKTGSTSNWTGSYFLNGIANGSFTSTNNSPSNTNVSIGRLGQANFSYLNAKVSEIIYYNSSQSSNRTGIENNINDYYNIYWNGDFAGLLDSFPSSAAAYSLRNLDKDYLGPLVRVRRSNDNAEQDIFGDYYGNLDTVGLKNFVGANSARVTIWYDQSGNGRNKTNATAATQPEIVFLGTIKRTNGKPCINFQGGNFLTSASTYTITHHVMVARVVAQSVINYSYTNANNGFFWNGSFGGVNGLGGFDGTNVRSSTGEDLNQHLGWFSQRSSSLFVGRDGGAETNTGSFAASITVDRLGGRQNAAGIDFVGEVQEVVAWNSDQSSNRTGIENNINTYFSIY